MERINVSELDDEELIRLMYDTTEEVEARLRYGGADVIRMKPEEEANLPF